MTVRFSASYADRLMACPGSANLELAIPGWQEPDRDDRAGAKAVGTDIHEILAEIAGWSSQDMWDMHMAVAEFAKLHITKRHAALEDHDAIEEWLLDQTYPSIAYETYVQDEFLKLKPFAPKMLRFISDATKAMFELFERVHLFSWASERSYVVTWLQSSPGTTPDLWLYDKQASHLYMIDFKSGAIPVQARNNKQLLYYATTVVHQEPEVDPATITLRVIQPGNDSEHTISRAELDAWKDEARAAEQRILNKDLSLVPSDKGCLFCPANPHTRGDKGAPLCPAMMDLLYPQPVEDSIYESL